MSRMFSSRRRSWLVPSPCRTIVLLSLSDRNRHRSFLFSMIFTASPLPSSAPASIRPVFPPPMMTTRLAGSVFRPKIRSSSFASPAAATAKK